MQPILVTSYANPDLDGTAGMIAYAEFLEKTGTRAVAGTLGRPHDEAQYVLDRFHIERPLSLTNTDQFEQVILVDASDLYGLEGGVAPEKVVEIIDHRVVHQAHLFPNAKVHIELVGAAATLVAEIFMRGNTPISKNAATLLLAAIISNTLNFKGNVTTERDRAAAHWLNTIAMLDDHFWHELFEAKSDLSGDKLVKQIEDDFAFFTFGETRIGIAQIEMLGAKKLLDERVDECIRALNIIKEREKLQVVFQNTIDLERSQSYLVVADKTAQDTLEKVIDVTFHGGIAEMPYLFMRKQIVPLLKQFFDGTSS
ncbi:DHH family phosphoesterase [Candidatus Uhrbacteria bacterium]|nr:DHH family phosphoesterase [Candidatus Uhrbacteria bacterium]